MQIQINTDHNVAGTEAFADHVKEIVTSALGHFSEQITRVEVHVSDQKGGEGGEGDKRCMLEARLRGRQPTAVTHQAQTLDEAIGGAADKLKRSLESTLGRLSDARTS